MTRPRWMRRAVWLDGAGIGFLTGVLAGVVLGLALAYAIINW